MVIRRRRHESSNVQDQITVPDALQNHIIVIQIPPEDLQSGYILVRGQDLSVFLRIPGKGHNILILDILQHFLQAGKTHSTGGAGQEYLLLLHLLFHGCAPVLVGFSHGDGTESRFHRLGIFPPPCPFLFSKHPGRKPVYVGDAASIFLFPPSRANLLKLYKCVSTKHCHYPQKRQTTFL